MNEHPLLADLERQFIFESERKFLADHRSNPSRENGVFEERHASQDRPMHGALEVIGVKRRWLLARAVIGRDFVAGIDAVHPQLKVVSARSIVTIEVQPTLGSDPVTETKTKLGKFLKSQRNAQLSVHLQTGRIDGILQSANDSLLWLAGVRGSVAISVEAISHIDLIRGAVENLPLDASNSEMIHSQTTGEERSAF